MQLFNTILGLAVSMASVSAIDIYCWPGSGCSGSGAVVCRGINPNTCCPCAIPGNKEFTSVSFEAIPKHWTLELRAYGGGGCSARRETKAVELLESACLNAARPYTGAGYGFINKRDGDAASADCTGSAKLDEFRAGGDGGVWYNLTALHGDEAKYNRMLALVTADTQVTDIPVEFDDIKIVE